MRAGGTTGLMRAWALAATMLTASLVPAQAAGDLIVAMPANQEPASLDGQVDPYQSTWLINSLIADPLVVLDPDAKYRGALAASWEPSPDGMVWTFRLKPNLKFQDDTPVDAAAVKFNFDRVVDPKTQSAQMRSEIGPVKSVEVVDPLTVKLTYEAPWVTLLDGLRRMPIWSPTAVQKAGAGFASQLVGAGPFTFVSRTPNDKIVMRKWAGYGGWNEVQMQKGPVSLDSVTIRWIGSDAVLGRVVESGDADVAMFLSPQAVADYKDNKDFVFYAKDQAGTGLQQVMNIRKPPLNDVRVRQALITATDRPALNKLLYDGLYAVSNGPLNDAHPCYWTGSTDLYKFDPAKAGQLLDAAGWTQASAGAIRTAKGVQGVTDGTPLKVRFTSLARKEMAEAIQAQLRKVGIDIVVEIVPGPVQLDRVNRRDFELIYERQRTPDPVVLDMVWNSKWDQPGGWAWTGFKDEAFDKLVGSLRTEPNFEKRCETAKQAQKIILENALQYPTLSDPVFVAMNKKVKGWQAGAEGNWFFVHNASK